ncbi:DUF998 domain-containing protein [Candidatus Bathyarchaeota archaeon]|nr:MAG: DUF998 domain-containing protein [Candidatus Bathyarchaeota archaeon]
MNQQTTLPAVCGIFAPLLTVALWAVASVLRPGYDQLAHKGSELGTGQNSIVMNVNFLVTGMKNRDLTELESLVWNKNLG